MGQYPSTQVERLSATRVRIRPEEFPDATVEIRVRRGHVDQPVEVTMRFEGEGRLHANDLRHAPWASWFRSAAWTLSLDTETWQLLRKYGGVDVPAIWTAGPAMEPGFEPRNRKPGRRGHPDSFYAEVAARYAVLVAEGANNPTARIASERVVSRATVSDWLAGARRRGMLPPARRGVAG